MNSDQLLPEANTNGSRISGDAAGQALHRKCYLPAAPLLAVMQDQISYLFGHLGGRCLPGCGDCARLEEVRKCLLKPFS